MNLSVRPTALASSRPQSAASPRSGWRQPRCAVGSSTSCPSGRELTTYGGCCWRAGTPDEALDLVEATLRRPEPFERRAFERCEAAVARLSAEPTRPIADIAAELGVSHGHLDRQFTAQVGLSPRTLSRILRMRQLLESIDVHGAVGWADKAAELGWSDQAHLIRDFKRHIGVTPSEYVAAQRSTYDRDVAAESAGFVPEPM